jgi:hypothetical protein
MPPCLHVPDTLHTLETKQKKKLPGNVQQQMTTVSSEYAA